MSVNGEDATLDPKLEKEARDMGWLPKEKFKGDEDRWVDAETYVERGRQIAPIMRANNERLRGETLQLKTENGTLRSELEALRAEVHEFKESATKKEVEGRRAQLVEQLKEAVRDDDVDAELKLREQIEALKVLPKPEVKPPPKDEGKVTPEFKKWNEANEWFGGTSSEDRKKTKEVTRIAEDLREDGSRLLGAEFMDAVMEEYDKRHKSADDDEPNDKHEAGANGSGRSGGKGFSSLPRAAKEACWADNDRLVGKGLMFENQKDWEAYYFKQYQEAGQ